MKHLLLLVGLWLVLSSPVLAQQQCISIILDLQVNHWVQLTWTASPTPNVIGYNIRRGTRSGAEGTTPINLYPLSSVAYVDLGLDAGTTVYYTATSVLSNGTESGPSV